MKKFIVILFLTFFGVLYAFGEETYTIQDNYQILSLRNKGGWLVDPTNSKDLEDIVNAPFNFEPQFFHGISSNTIWAKYNLTSTEETCLVFYTRGHKIDNINFYAVYENGEIEQVSSGFNVRMGDRDFRYRRPAFSFNLEKNEKVTIYVSIRNRAKIYTDFKVTGALNFFQQNLGEERFLFFIFGAIIIIALYNLMVFFSLKDKNYLYYFLYIFFMFMYDISVEGFGGYYLWPEWDWFNPRSYSIFMSFSYFWVLIFARSFLNVSHFNSRLDSIFKYGKYLFLLCLILFLFHPSPYIVSLTTFCTLLGLILLLFSGIYVWSKGYKPAKYFCLAWIFLITGTLITTFRRLSILPNTLFTEYAIYVGTAIEAVFLAFALGDRVHCVQKEKLEAEEALIDANNRVLQNRMKPHFLFNSMNIIFNQLKESPQKAMSSLSQLSDNYHYITEFNDKPIIAFKEEWEFLNNYLELMKLRWPDNLIIKKQLDEKLNCLPVPPIILQPLAENAFKYGLKIMENKILEVKCYVEKETVHLMVKNNTAIPLGHVDYSRSLSNIENRLKRYYNDTQLKVYQKDRFVVSEISFRYPGKL